MNLNDIFKKDNLTEEEYIFIKQQAYNIAANKSGKEILNHIEDLKIKELKDTYATLIDVTTLTFPNDLDFINELENKENNNLGKIYLKEKLKMPLPIVHFKVFEFEQFKTADILANNVELRKLAGTSPHFESKNKQSR